MKKRVFAWVLLIGFVLLLLNLIVFRFYWQVSMVLYIIIVFGFILSGGNLFYTKKRNNNTGNFDLPDDNTDADTNTNTNTNTNKEL